MKLLLLSQRLQNPSLNQVFLDLLAKPTTDSKAVYIPTAGNPITKNPWVVQDMHSLEQLSWKGFSIIDLAVVAGWSKDLWWKLIEEADVIMVGGGNSGYLSYWMQKSGLMAELPRLLETKVYVGSSAGSMFLTPGQTTSSDALDNAPAYILPDRIKGVPEGEIARETLAITDFLFRPHWHAPGNEDVTEEILQKAANATGLPVYLVDDQTGIKIVDGEVEVISEGEWKLITPH
jgi:dipeptidase E